MGQPFWAAMGEGLEGAVGRRSCGSAGAGGTASLQNTHMSVFIVTYEICGLRPASGGNHGISRAHRMISFDFWPNLGGWEVE